MIFIWLCQVLLTLEIFFFAFFVFLIYQNQSAAGDVIQHLKKENPSQGRMFRLG